jgi:hypothetical protein
MKNFLHLFISKLSSALSVSANIQLCTLYCMVMYMKIPFSCSVVYLQYGILELQLSYLHSKRETGRTGETPCTAAVNEAKMHHSLETMYHLIWPVYERLVHISVL